MVGITSEFREKVYTKPLEGCVASDEVNVGKRAISDVANEKMAMRGRDDEFNRRWVEVI